MTKEKFKSLTKYVQEMEAKLNSPVPTKWEHSPESYKNFLKNEIRLHTRKIQDHALVSKDGK